MISELRRLAAARHRSSPRSFYVRGRSFSTVNSSLSWSPGTTGRRNFAPSIPVKRRASIRGREGWQASRRRVCAIASTISIPAYGAPGKWPSKNGSLSVTFLMPTPIYGFVIDYSIDEQERIAMRQDGHDLRYVEDRLRASCPRRLRVPMRRFFLLNAPKILRQQPEIDFRNCQALSFCSRAFSSRLSLSTISGSLDRTPATAARLCNPWRVSSRRP